MKEVVENIWGKFGCELPNGNLCIACCVLPNIELEGTYVSVGKPANSPCPHLVSEQGENGQGCIYSGGGKPDACSRWHCSMMGLDGKLDLIAQSLSLGQVSEEEATSSASRLLKGNAVDLTNTTILARSAKLSEITYKRELVVRDLDET